MMANGRSPATSPDGSRDSYLRVVLIWLATLAALYGFQEYFG